MAVYLFENFTDLSYYNLSFFIFPTADLIDSIERYFEIYSLLLSVATAVKPCYNIAAEPLDTIQILVHSFSLLLWRTAWKPEYWSRNVRL
jgi:hypothetical protein